MNHVIKTVLWFVALALVFWLIESIWTQNRKQPKWRRGYKSDTFYWFFNIGCDFAIVRALGIFTLLITSFFVAYNISLPTKTFVNRQPAWLQMVAALLIADFIGYWVHRAFHETPLLWRLHALHHSSINVDWLASARFHPIETTAVRIAETIPLFLLGFSPGVFGSFALVRGIYPILLHANVGWGYGKLGYVLTSPAFHRWHHAADPKAINKNYTTWFSWIDFLFGTAYFPRGRYPVQYGLLDKKMPDGVLSQLAYPLRKGSPIAEPRAELKATADSNHSTNSFAAG